MTISQTADVNAIAEHNERVERKIFELETQLKEIKETLAAIKQTLVNTEGIVQKVAAEVMPTIDSLVKSPMLKMLLPKGKK